MLQLQLLKNSTRFCPLVEILGTSQSRNRPKTKKSDAIFRLFISIWLLLKQELKMQQQIITKKSQAQLTFLKNRNLQSFTVENFVRT